MFAECRRRYQSAECSGSTYSTPRSHVARARLPAPQTVNRPRTKSTKSVGTLKGRQRSWLGVMSARSKSPLNTSIAKSSGWKGSCVTEGRMRYSQLRWLHLPLNV